jgi:hypothetical protein
MKNIMNIPSLRILCATVVLSLIMVGCGGDDDEENEGNHKPVVHINQTATTINVGTKVNLTALATDSDNDALTQKWSFLSKPTGSSATLTTDTKKATSFTADKAGKYIIEFTAKDTVGAESKEAITITAKDAGAISNTCTTYTEISGTYSTDKTLKGCFKVVGNIRVSNNALLTIEKGSTLVFQNSVELTVGGDGALKAVGTVTEPILFTGEQKTAGYWKGLRFYYSNNVKNELDYVTVEYGGGNSYGNVVLDASSGNPSRLKISNSTLRHSSEYGFWFDDGAIIDKFTNVTSTKNSKSAGLLSASALDSLDNASKFTGNSHDNIALKGSSLNKDAVWQPLTVPVNVLGDINIYNNLKIKSNSTFLMNNGVTFTINSTGSLIAKGTKSESILFTGEQKTAGYWKGLRFYYSNNVKNELDYVTVEYGGGNGYGNVLLDASSGNPSRLKISNSTLQHSSKYGFWFDDGAIIDKFTNVTSTKNSKSAGLLSASALDSLDSASKFTGNSHDNIALKGSSLNKDTVWQPLTVPVNALGDINIYNNLEIKSDSTFLMNSGVAFTINSAGSLIAKGTKAKPILFTGKQQTAGYWKGLRFYYSNNAKNKLDYVTVEYGGGNGYGNIVLDASSGNPCRLQMTNSLLQHSSKYGLWLDEGSITNNDISSSNSFIDNNSGSVGSN